MIRTLTGIGRATCLPFSYRRNRRRVDRHGRGRPTACRLQAAPPGYWMGIRESWLKTLSTPTEILTLPEGASSGIRKLIW